jgi:ribulose kinase
MRAGLFELRGRPVSTAQQAYATAHPAPGRAEQRPEDWWRALAACTRACLQQAAIEPARVIGLAIAAPSTILLVDRQGEPLTPGLLEEDLRGAPQADRIIATAQPALRFSGGLVPAEWPLPKALWLKEQEPALWGRASLIVDMMSWLTWRLTGAWTFGLCNAVCRWHYRPGTGWPDELFTAGGLQEIGARIPRIMLPMGGRVGALSAQAAQELGLTAATGVALAGLDAYAGMVGLNALEQGTLALLTGPSTYQIALWDEPAFDPGMLGPFEDAVLPGTWSLEAEQVGTGSTVRWLIELMDGTALGVPAVGNRHVHVDQLAAAVPAGAGGLTLLEQWQGSKAPIRDPGARGAITGLSPAHGPGHLLRAVYEGTAYGSRRILALLADLGVPIARIVAGGGGTRSRLWLQILADVTGTPVALTAMPDGAVRGAAICAAVGAGAYADLRDAASAMVEATDSLVPDETLREIYDRGYSRYIATYAALHRVRVEHPAAGEPL